MELIFILNKQPDVVFESFIISDLPSIPRKNEFCTFDKKTYQVQSVEWNFDKKEIRLYILDIQKEYKKKVKKFLFSGYEG